MTVTLSDTRGNLHVTASGGATVAGNDTASQTIAGTVSDVNATLATLTYTATGTGSDSLTINATDNSGAGNAQATAKIVSLNDVASGGAGGGSGGGSTTTVLPAPTTIQEATQEITTAFTTVLRGGSSSHNISTDADALLKGTISLSTYISGLITEAKDTTGGALSIFQALLGKTPDAGTLTQEAALMAQLAKIPGGAGGTANAWEAIGASLADSSFSGSFKIAYGSLSDDEFIATAFKNVFGSTLDPIVKTRSNLLHLEFDIFKAYYGTHPDATDPTGIIRAKGAFLADMLHQSSDIAYGTFWNAEVALLTKAATQGDTVFGSSMFV